MIRFRPGAKSDVRAIFDWYSQRSPRLSARFLRELGRTVRLITAFPDIGGRIEGDVRAVRIKRFPYIVYYINEGDVQRVYCVVHASRDERVWKDRI